MRDDEQNLGRIEDPALDFDPPIIERTLLGNDPEIDSRRLNWYESTKWGIAGVGIGLFTGFLASFDSSHPLLEKVIGIGATGVIGYGFIFLGVLHPVKAENTNLD